MAREPDDSDFTLWRDVKRKLDSIKKEVHEPLRRRIAALESNQAVQAMDICRLRETVADLGQRVRELESCLTSKDEPQSSGS